MAGARPAGCRLSRSTFTGGASSSGAALAVSRPTASLAATRFHERSTASAGYGW